MIKKNEEAAIKKSRFFVYLCAAMLVAGLALYVLAQEPAPGWPINLIHLLFKR